TISIDNVQSSFEDLYSARFFIGSSTGFQDVDKEWRFPYRRNQMLLFDHNIFDGLTGLIDFYINIIIGEELDRYSEFGGSAFYSRAQQISQLGKSDRYNRWWEKRSDYARRYLQESHKPFRRMSAWFYAAHYWTLEGVEDEAKIAAAETLKLLKEVNRNTFEQEFKVNFLNRELNNLAHVFSQFDDMYMNLMELDPEHKDFYLNYRKK
ncbi:DUF4835 family protein, partial [candidate division KSB1 bacterium]